MLLAPPASSVLLYLRTTTFTKHGLCPRRRFCTALCLWGQDSAIIAETDYWNVAVDVLSCSCPCERRLPACNSAKQGLGVGISTQVGCVLCFVQRHWSVTC